MKRLLLVTGIVVAAAAAVIFLRQPESGAESDWSKPEMARVPAGSFLMGNASFERSLPAHTVTLTDDFYIGKYEITNQQYADMLNYALGKGYLNLDALSEKAKRREAQGATKPPEKYQDVFDEHSRVTFADGKFKPHAGFENHPVVEVTWNGAAFYCNMLSEKEGLAPLYNLSDWSCQVYGKTGYRLPTEAEWEYAAKYDDGRTYPWGSAAPDPTLATIDKVIKDPADVETEPVGAHSPKGDSKLGIADMAGNAAEWCNDWYNYYRAGDQADPVGPPPSLFINLPVFKEFRPLLVVRGGSFMTDPAYRKGMGPPFIMDCVLHPEVFDNSFRSFEYRSMSRQTIGFRVAKVVATAKTKPALSAAQR